MCVRAIFRTVPDPEEDSPPDAVAVETPSSWSFGGMIGVLIGGVVIAVVVYIVYYNKDKV